MNIEQVRNFTLSLLGVTEDQPFGDDNITFRIEGKIFLCLWLGTGKYDASENMLRFACKLPPERNEELRDEYSAITPAFHWNKKHWSDVFFEQLETEFVERIIKEAYGVVVRKLPKAKREKYVQPLFVETIKIKDGRSVNLPYHQARMEKTIRHFFPELALKNMPCLEKIVASKEDACSMQTASPKEENSLFKVRVVYSGNGIELVECAPYSMRPINSLKIVHDDSIDYSYKSCDRSSLNALTALKGDCDEIIIVKNNLITDTSFTNLAIFDGHNWLTPKHPLLHGTKRAYLLDKGLIKEADITVDDLMKAKKIRLFNAMIEFGEREIESEKIKK